MATPEYADGPPVQCSTTFDLSSLAGKSIIITGGASGLGKAYVEAFAEAGSFVTIADIADTAGERLAEILKDRAQYVHCDVLSWDDQVAVFEAAVQNSPSKSCDIVIANAGIIGQDDLYKLQDPHGPPVKPNLKIVDINLTGAIYTSKLALHYFRKQPLNENRDRCLIIKSSIAGYIDVPGSPQYNISKYAVRGLFSNLRRTIWSENIRVNMVSPWYMRTPILGPRVQEFLDSQGVGFAQVEDAVRAMCRIATDMSINGRCLGVVPRSNAASGYMDMQKDDYQDGDMFKSWQDIALATAKAIVE